MSNTFGRLFRVTTFGESHGPAIGCVIDGCPAGIKLDTEDIQRELDRRKPGTNRLSSQRREGDAVEVLSGVYDGHTMGTPIGLLIRNHDARSRDYEELASVFRPGHADYTYHVKYAGRHDRRGGGRSSARETAARVAAGAVARALLQKGTSIEIASYVQQVGELQFAEPLDAWYNRQDIDCHAVRCPDVTMATQMADLIDTTRKSGDTIGGVVACRVRGLPVGWGEPVFDKLHARLAYALMGINAAKGVEFALGFNGTHLRGSAYNDLFTQQDGHISTLTNHAGGTLGGISSGMPLYMRVAFKPVATIPQEQPTVDLQGNPATVIGKGRHDPCVLPRAVPIVDAMVALVLADFMLLTKAYKPIE